MGMETIRTKIDELIEAFKAEGITPDIDIWIHVGRNPDRTIEQNIDAVQVLTGQSTMIIDYSGNVNSTCVKPVEQMRDCEIYTFAEGDCVEKGVAYLDGLHENSK